MASAEGIYTENVKEMEEILKATTKSNEEMRVRAADISTGTECILLLF